MDPRMPDTAPPTASIEALGVHVWHLQQTLIKAMGLMERAATQDDIRSVHSTLATLATRTEMENKIQDVRERLLLEMTDIRRDHERELRTVLETQEREIKALRAEVAANKLSTIFRWLVGVAVGFTAVLGAWTLLVQHIRG
jgi:hypothetical protein